MATLCLALLAGTQCSPDAAGPDALQTAIPAVGADAAERNVDSFALEGAEAPSEHISIQPGADTLPQVGDTIRLRAVLYIASNAPRKALVKWTSLDPAIARLEGSTTTRVETIRVRGMAKGLARVLATVESMVDTAFIWVTPPPPVPTGLPAKVRIQPDSVKISGVGGAGFFSASVRDANDVVIPNLTINWSTLEPGIATTTQGGVVTGIKSGTARIVARYGTFADTGRVIVGTGGPPTGTYIVVLSPNPGTISTIGGTLQLDASVSELNGPTVAEAALAWKSLNESVATVGSSGLVRAVAAGTVRIVGNYKGAADTATVSVGTPPSGGKRYVVVLSPSNGAIASPGGALQLTASVSELNGPAVVGAKPTWKSVNTSIASVSSFGMVTGLTAGTARIVASYSGAADTATVTVGTPPPPPPPSPAPAGQLTPGSLIPVVGRLIARSTSTLQPHATYDQRFLQYERSMFDNFVACQATCLTDPNHYGGLRSRMMWAIRNGEPIGPAATDEKLHAYARGRTIVKRYLRFTKANGYSVRPDHNTGLPDVETLWVLERDQDAYNHLWVSASKYSYDPYGYMQFTHAGSDPRQALVALMAFSAAHRLGIPFKRPAQISGVGFDGSQGSWKATGDRQVNWIRNGTKADGSLPSPAHSGQEAFLFSAWTVTELLRWNANVEWTSGTFDLARRLMDHIIDAYNKVYKAKGWITLPYTTNGTYEAHDLAAFFIWPSLVLWQETGNTKYRDFAVLQIQAANKAWMGGIKQFNQTYSTLGESAETMLSGVRWR